MPINLEIEIFIFLVRYVIVVLLVLVAFTCDKLFPHYMCLTLITIYCLACCSSIRRARRPQPPHPLLSSPASSSSSNNNNSRQQQQQQHGATAIFGQQTRTSDLGPGLLVGDRHRGRHPPSTFCLLYTSPSPRDGLLSRMPSSA